MSRWLRVSGHGTLTRPLLDRHGYVQGYMSSVTALTTGLRCRKCNGNDWFTCRGELPPDGWIPQSFLRNLQVPERMDVTLP